MRKVIPLILVVLAALLVFKSSSAQHNPVFYSSSADKWADSVMERLTPAQKVGQLFMVAAYSNKGKEHQAEIETLVKDYGIGGLIFFQGGPVRQIRLTNQYQKLAKVPLMIGMDAEWDLAMRLDSTYKLPWPLTVGGANDSTLAYQYGYTIGKHCKRLGVHVNFGPDVDINSNPNNPIINARSFGEDPKRVIVLSRAYMQGQQDAGVLACAKHFPGHGDTESDSHKTLPVVNQTRKHLEEIELAPYRDLTRYGLGSVMVAHLNVPAIDSTGRPTSLSRLAVQDLLRDDMGFEGLIFTDALNMKGVANMFPPGEVDLEALLAGNDILLFAENVPRARKLILEAIEDGKISQEEVDEHVKRILKAKYWQGLNRFKPLQEAGVVADLNDQASDRLTRNIFKKAVTVVSNPTKIIPIVDFKEHRIVVLNFGKTTNSSLTKWMNRYTKVDEVFVENGNYEAALKGVSEYDVVVAAHFTDNANPWKSFKMTDADRAFVDRLILQNKVILVHFGNPYGLSSLRNPEHFQSVIVAYQNHEDAALGVAEVLFGARPPQGKLPVKASDVFPLGAGLGWNSLGRLQFGFPEDAGMNSRKLAQMEKYLQEAMKSKAIPGAQVVVIRKGIVVWNKAYGYHTYDQHMPVKDDDLYDIASVTKISASVPALMKMVDEGYLDLNKTLGDYLPELKGSNKENLVIKDVLTHQAGLEAWIPFYIKTLKNGMPNPKIYSKAVKPGFNIQVARDMFIRDDYRDTLFQRILESPIGAKEYKYSDLGYYLFQRIIENHYQKKINELDAELFYGPLGMTTTTYLPLEKFDSKRILPTEDDNYFRYQLINGFVHDQGAAMMGGVAGHAGLFSSALDLSKLMQMYLQGGTYGGKEYLKSATIQNFASCPFCQSKNQNRRGIGFDKPQLSGEGPTCGCVSLKSYGHTGFTGTIAWVDPTEEIVYVFLSNRVYPTAENKGLIKMGTRTEIQRVIYESLEK